MATMTMITVRIILTSMMMTVFGGLMMIIIMIMLLTTYCCDLILTLMMMMTTVFGGVNRQYVRLTPHVQLMSIIRGIGGLCFKFTTHGNVILMM